MPTGWSGEMPEEFEDWDLIRNGLTWHDISGQPGPLPWYVRQTFVMFRRIEREAAMEASKAARG